MALQAQWSLDNTADSAIAISRGIFKAATSDNVQPLAIFACERFGNTLAICPETCHKVERVILPTPKPAVLKFMRGVVGYSAHDCATQLGSSLAGVRFLALATALVTSIDLFKAAQALSSMLESSASDQDILPTVLQLKELLASVEPRCQRSGFAEEIVGWQMMLRNALGISEDNYARPNTCFPSPGAIAEVVDTFRRLHRIGDSTVESATFGVRRTAPWLIAFTKWCLGKPPSVYLDDGTPLMEQTGKKVSIIIRTSKRHDELMSITIHHNITGPQTLLADPEGGFWRGMVSIETFGKLFLANKVKNLAREMEALRECLPKAIRLVLQFIRFSDTEASLQAEKCETCPFPNDGIISDIVGRLLNLSASPDLPMFDPKHCVTNSAAVQAHYIELENLCECDTCPKKGNNSPNMGDICLKSNFELLVLDLTCTALALSLFDCPELLKVSTDSVDRPYPLALSSVDSFVSVVMKRGFLTSRATTFCDIVSLKNLALHLVGHDTELLSRGLRKLQMSSLNGQTVYYKMFDTQRIVKRGYLGLSWHPGFLSLKGQKYTAVYSQVTHDTYPDFETEKAYECYSRGSTKSKYRFALEWHVANCDGVLSLELGFTNSRGKSRFALHAPSQAVHILKNWVIMDGCEHENRVGLEGSGSGLRYEDPLSSLFSDVPENEVCVVRAEGSSLVPFSVAANAAVNRGVVCSLGACLDCCIKASNATGSKVIIF